MSALKVFSERTFYTISMNISNIIDYVEELLVKQLCFSPFWMYLGNIKLALFSNFPPGFSDYN